MRVLAVVPATEVGNLVLYLRRRHPTHPVRLQVFESQFQRPPLDPTRLPPHPCVQVLVFFPSWLMIPEVQAQFASVRHFTHIAFYEPDKQHFICQETQTWSDRKTPTPQPQRQDDVEVDQQDANGAGVCLSCGVYRPSSGVRRLVPS